MNLYIVRHGHADGTSPDSERNLTDFGRSKLIDVMTTWKTYIDKIDLIFTSPYKRSVETAKIIHKNFNVKKEIIKDRTLQPGIRISDVIATFSALDEEDILLVGHMPDVSDLVAELVAPTSFGYPFSPGTLAAIEFEGKIRMGAGKLKLLLPEGK